MGNLPGVRPAAERSPAAGTPVLGSPAQGIPANTVQNCQISAIFRSLLADTSSARSAEPGTRLRGASCRSARHRWAGFGA